MRARLSKSFWQGRRVFVTGHTGFKGGWLMALLERLGAKASGYALPPLPGDSLFEAAGIASLGTSTFGDIRDAAALEAAMAAAQPDIVLHLAAQALVRPARVDPIETLSTNVVGTAHVLDAVRKTESVRATVVVTSDKVYDNVEWPWAYRETDRLGGKEPYGASKACAEIVADAYRYSYFKDAARPMALATARAGNVIGGGDWAEDRLIPDAVRAFSKGEPLVVRNPSAVRPWQHALEPLSGYLRLAETLCDGASSPKETAFNFGPCAEDAVPVAAIVDRVVGLWGEAAAWQQDQAFHPYEARLLEVDSAQARAVLGWEPTWRLDTALAQTIAWYKAYYGKEAMQAHTLAQIDAYLDG